jgi:hypothetical protein
VGRAAAPRGKQGGSAIRLRHLALVASLAMLPGAGCAAQPSRSASTTSQAATAMRVLATSAVPGVPSTTTVLAIGELAKDASISGLDSKIASWGYVDGRQRTFQGPSRHLTLVVSRSLVFMDAIGAKIFVASVVANSASYFGAGVHGRRLLAQARSGWMFTPAPCACHLANPAFIGVLIQGTDVVWLEINGPDATPALLVRLLDPSRSVVAK